MKASSYPFHLQNILFQAVNRKGEPILCNLLYGRKTGGLASIDTVINNGVNDAYKRFKQSPVAFNQSSYYINNNSDLDAYLNQLKSVNEGRFEYFTELEIYYTNSIHWGNVKVALCVNGELTTDEQIDMLKLIGVSVPHQIANQFVFDFVALSK